MDVRREGRPPVRETIPAATSWPASRTPRWSTHGRRALTRTYCSGAGTATQPVIEAIEELSTLASADHDTKMRGLYVDYNNGSLLNPADVTEPEALRMLTSLRACLDDLAPLTDIEQMSELALAMAQLSQVFTQMRSEDDVIQLLQRA